MLPRGRALQQDHHQLDHPQEEEGDRDHQCQGSGARAGGPADTKPPTTAGSAKVKQQALTLGAASSFKLAVKAKGSSAKKLKKKGKATVTVYADLHAPQESPGLRAARS